MTDRTDDPRDWDEDNNRFEAEAEAVWEAAEALSAKEHEAFAPGFTDFCATEGCEGAGTEELMGTYVCMPCYQRIADAAYERERDREWEGGR